MRIGIDEALTTAFGHNTVEYRRYSGATRLDTGPILLDESPMAELHRARRYLAEGKEKSLVLLRQAVRSLEEEITDREKYDPSGIEGSPEAARRDVTKVFIVHGHDEAARETVARFVEKLGFEAIILHERPNKGRTIITKFREEAANVGFAVVLMTPDDVGRAKDAAELKPRARQKHGV
jgi:hypothetical protein